MTKENLMHFLWHIFNKCKKTCIRSFFQHKILFFQKYYLMHLFWHLGWHVVAFVATYILFFCYFCVHLLVHTFVLTSACICSDICMQLLWYIFWCLGTLVVVPVWTCCGCGYELTYMYLLIPSRCYNKYTTHTYIYIYVIYTHLL